MLNEESENTESASVEKKKKAPLTSDDAEYLQGYVKISEDFLFRVCTSEKAHSRLKKLNKQFKGRISPKIKRTSIMGDFLADGEEGWLSSSIGC